jgi:DNA invertase Pin-like site-specific DNA recombinase
MRPGISVKLKPRDHRRLEAIVGDRNAPQKQVWRAAIVLLSADGHGTVEIMRRTGKSKTCVWRWQSAGAARTIPDPEHHPLPPSTASLQRIQSLLRRGGI